jgi:biotin carboxyl carrier protein
MASDLEGIRHALTIARNRGYAEVSVEDGDLKFRAALEPLAVKRTAVQQASDASQEGASEHDDPGFEEIRSPLVGYFRPGDIPMVEGQVLKVGDIVGVVASLGDIPYAVEATVAGEVVDVLVQADQPVEYGQVLMTVKP